ncbi:hypothetical protein, partial [Ligilactobacillus ruminis]|uniref:hypothetical protein n=1 Tax=Ligilactobacillus ruminis TaxID=1623 RepID=UPI0022E279A5
VMVCCNRFTSLSSYINYIISMCENLRKGKGKKEAPQVLERGFSPITKVTGFQPIYLSMKNTVLSASIDFLIRLNYRGDAAVYRQNCGKGDLTLIVPGAALKAEPLPPSSVRTTSKADKNRGECLIFVYRLVQNRSARSRK